MGMSHCADSIVASAAWGLELAVLAADSGIRPANWWPTHAPFLRAHSGATKYPTLIEVFEPPPAASNGLEFGLQRVLDGIEAMLEQRTPSAKRRPRSK